MQRQRVTLLTGGTGFLGGLVAATLLTRADDGLVVPVRSHHDDEGFWGPVRAEIIAQGGELTDRMIDRVQVVQLPSLDRIDELGRSMTEFGVTEIVHCAGCLDYFDPEMLEAINVELTKDLLALGAKHGVDRFVYMSTAFSSGLLSGSVPEELHAMNGVEDPTDYTRSKRQAELAVASSGLPFLIMRPPIVIGHSADGRYGGKRYGIYQLWAGMERLFFTDWYPDVYFVGSLNPLPLIHQDSFQEAFIGAYGLLPDGSVFNMVSPHSPSLRELACLWYPACMAPERIHLYEALDDVPLLDINRRQRAFLGLTSTNIKIASHAWFYDTPNTTLLNSMGVSWTPTSLDSVAVCQQRFTRSSPKITQFIADNRERFDRQPEVVLS